MRTILACLVALTAVGCGDDDGLADAGGTPDVTVADATSGDAPAEDAETTDSGAEDSGVDDAGVESDGSTDDAGPGDDAGDGMVCGGKEGGRCMDTEFCLYDRGCGFDDGTGICTVIPEACPRIIDPVCGCDGMTYQNECLANAAGVSAQADGECAPTERRCGARLGDTCGRGEFCLYGIRDICGAADATGVCTMIPESCEPVRAPVCGCDDMTYGNECLANMAGTSAAGRGPCEEP